MEASLRAFVADLDESGGFSLAHTPLAGETIQLTPGKLLVGRAKDCRLRLDGKSVSLHHCVLMLDDYSLRIRDLGSETGTIVNGNRIGKHELVLLHGDTVTIDKFTFQVDLGQAADDVEIPSAEEQPWASPDDLDGFFGGDTVFGGDTAFGGAARVAPPDVAKPPSSQPRSPSPEPRSKEEGSVPEAGPNASAPENLPSASIVSEGRGAKPKTWEQISLAPFTFQIDLSQAADAVAITPAKAQPRVSADALDGGGVFGRDTTLAADILPDVVQPPSSQTRSPPLQPRSQDEPSVRAVGPNASASKNLPPASSVSEGRGPKASIWESLAPLAPDFTPPIDLSQAADAVAMTPADERPGVSPDALDGFFGDETGCVVPTDVVQPPSPQPRFQSRTGVAAQAGFLTTQSNPSAANWIAQPTTDHSAPPFAARFPSANWEQISLAPLAPGFVWAWFKPPTNPNGLLLRLPDQSQGGDQSSAALTLRHLLHAVRIELAEVSLCYLYGVAVDLCAAGALQLDLPLGPPSQGADPNIVVLVAGPTASNLQPSAAPQTQLQTPSSIRPDTARFYDDIDSDWNVAVQLERQLVLERKKLSNMSTRLGTLDRDLSPDERLHGDRQAKTDWQEARRGLKDAAARLARYIKEHDTGETSVAGKRLYLQQTFEQIVTPRRPVDNIVELQREFEAYRKRLQVLLKNMNKAYNTAAQDGERRAQEVLRRIHASVRTASGKK